MYLKAMIASSLTLLMMGTARAQSEALVAQAEKEYEGKNYPACASLYSQSFLAMSQYFVDDQSMHDNYYNAACCHALAGKKAEAVTLLQKAVDSPFFWDAKHLKEDKDLAGLHAEPEWSTLVNQAEAAAAAREPMTYASLDYESARKNPPKVPPQAERAGGSGLVILVVTVGADGIPKKILIERSSGDDLLDSAAAETAKVWKYNPATTKNGNKLSGKVRVPVEFRLRKKVMIDFR